MIITVINNVKNRLFPSIGVVGSCLLHKHQMLWLGLVSILEVFCEKNL